MEELEFRLHEEKGCEDFEKEDDMTDWQFPLEALKWWEGKVQELQDLMDN